MAELKYQDYAMKDGVTPLNEDYFNPIFKDIDNRIVAVSDIGDRVDAATTDLIQNGLKRIDDYLRPAYENISALAELGFLNATLDGDAPVTFSIGVQTVIISEGPEREQFHPTPFIVFGFEADVDLYAVAQSVSFNRDTGAFTVNFLTLSVALAADPGPHTAVFIAAAAASVMATLGYIDAAQQKVVDAQAKVDAAQTKVTAATTQATAAAASAVTAGTFASASATSAGVASAAATAAVTAKNDAATTVQGILGSYFNNAFPATRRDGSALQLGDILYDKTDKLSRAWDGSSFAAMSFATIGGLRFISGTFGASPSGIITVTGGFSQALVFLNGALLPSTAYASATPLITINAPVNGDRYFVWAYKAIDATDYYTKEETDANIAASRAAIEAEVKPWVFTKKVPRTANTMLVAADALTFIDITSGTFTQTFAASASLGDGWSILLRNSGTGDITLDPNAAETIDALSSYVMYPGEMRRVFCNGTSLYTLILASFKKRLTTSTSLVTPPGYNRLGYRHSGGGGGGGGGYLTANAGGGAGATGQFVTGEIDTVGLAATLPVVIGAAGVHGNNGTPGTAGTDGGDSTFAGSTALGGRAGGGASGISSPGTGGALRPTVTGTGDVVFGYAGAAGAAVPNTPTAGPSHHRSGVSNAGNGGNGGSGGTGSISPTDGETGELNVWGIV